MSKHKDTAEGVENQEPISTIGGIDDSAVITDSDGKVFDSKVHVTDSNGVPKKNKSGKFRLRPGQAGAKLSQKKEVDDIALAEQSANLLINMSTNLASTVGGDAWKPSASEDSLLKTATAGYLASKGDMDIPPGILLALALTAYITASYARMPAKPKLAGIRKFFAGDKKEKSSEKKNDGVVDVNRKNDPELV